MALDQLTDGLRWAIYGSLVPVGVAVVTASVLTSFSGAQLSELIAGGVLAPPTLMMALAAYGAVAAPRLNVWMALFATAAFLEVVFVLLGLLVQTYADDISRHSLVRWNVVVYAATVMACVVLEVRRTRRS